MADKTNADKLKARFHQVFRSASQEFEAAIFEFELYLEDASAAMAEAPVDRILVMQGRVQQAQAVLRILKECRDYKPRQPAPPAQSP